MRKVATLLPRAYDRRSQRSSSTSAAWLERSSIGWLLFGGAVPAQFSTGAAYFAIPAFFARYSAHRFFVAATIRFRPAALILRLLVGAAAFAAAFVSAQRFRCAAAILRRPAALILRFFGSGPEAGSRSVPSSRRISAILA